MMQPSNRARKDSPLRTERLLRHWSQRELAERLGATIATVKRWERQVTTPSPFFRLKLTALFGKSECDLGFYDSDTSPVLTSSEALEQQEKLIIAVPNLEEDKIVPQEIDSSPVQMVMPQNVSISKKSRNSDQTMQDIREHYRRHKRLFGFLFMLTLACMAFLISWSTQAFSLHTISATSRSSTPSSVFSAPSAQVLYEAQWGRGLSGWSVSEHCTWSGDMGGEILTDGGNGNDVLVAPYRVSRSDYAIEVSMKRISYTPGGGDAYGVVVRNTSQEGGYIAGVGIHFLPEHFFIGFLTPSGDNGSEYVSSDLARAPASLDTQWHIYRVEVRGSIIRLLIDGRLVAQGESNLHIQAGNVGIYIDSARIAMRNFKLLALS